LRANDCAKVDHALGRDHVRERRVAPREGEADQHDESGDEPDRRAAAGLALASSW
jgi:hypothetical protein